MWDFPCSSLSKESACHAGDPGLNPGLGRFPGEGNGNPLQYSCLENPMDRGAWWAIVQGATRVGHDLVTKPPPPPQEKKKKTIKNTNIWRLNNMPLNNQQIIEEIKKQIKLCIEMNENENTTTQNLWDSVEGKVHSNTSLLQATGEKSNK